MNAKYKKVLKLVSLLLTATIIATASANVYSYMYIDGSVTIGSPKLVWLKDASADATIAGGTITMDLDVEAGVIQNFTDWIRLNNTDIAAHNVTISVTTELSTSTFDSAIAYLYKNDTATTLQYVDTLNLTTLNDQYSTTFGTELLSYQYYSFTFEIQAAEGTSGTVNFDLETVYE
jgi:hypothetical protein